MALSHLPSLEFVEHLGCEESSELGSSVSASLPDMFRALLASPPGTSMLHQLVLVPFMVSQGPLCPVYPVHLFPSPSQTGLSQVSRVKVKDP